VQAAQFAVDLDREAAAIAAVPPLRRDLGERRVDDAVELRRGVGDRLEPVRVLVRLVGGERPGAETDGENDGEPDGARGDTGAGAGAAPPTGSRLRSGR